MKDEFETKAVVCVAEMARMIGLGRSRFHQLIGTTFPWPVYDRVSRRPLYLEEQQLIVIQIRRRNCGIDGRPVLFYASRGTAQPTTRRPATKPKGTTDGEGQYQDIIDFLETMELEPVTATQVNKVIADLYPNGIASVNRGEVMKAVYLSIKRQNSSGNAK